MSYNIRYNNPADGENQWDLRKDRLVQKVTLDDCDIIGFQEVLASQMNYLDSTMTDYKWVGVGRDDGKQGGEYAPIFYKKDKFSIDHWGTQWLSETPDTPSLGWDAACIRIASWAVLKSQEDGSCMLFINTHFDHVGQQARINGSRVIVALADSLKGVYGKLPLVLTGDFNSVVQDDALTPIVGSFRYGMDACANPVAPS
ncbi:MAG: endonuclease/exonuclease/phosphatase family protein, partial [Rikenellaceae bacterium]